MRNENIKEEQLSSGTIKDEDVKPSGQPVCVSVDVCHRHKWSVEEGEAVKDVFGSHIKNKKVSIDDVRDIVLRHPLLKSIAPSKVRDKVRTYFHGEPTTVLPVPPEEEETPSEKLNRFGVADAALCKEEGEGEVEREEKSSMGVDGDEASQFECPSSPSTSSSMVPPSSRGRGGQERLFTEKEMVEFRKLFYAVIHSAGPITTKIAVSMLEGSKKLKHLTKKLTNQQIYDKLRTERKIANREKPRKK